MARAEIDPQLPYIQVHRSVARKAAALAPALGVTYQHVRGAMDGFWEDLSERRTLRRGLERPLGPAVVLGEAELAGKLRLAFGMVVDPALLVWAGFLELVPDGHRVRGMSRQMDTEAARLKQSGWLPPKSTAGALAVDRVLTGGPPEVHSRSTGGGPPVPPAVDLRYHLRPIEVRDERRDVRRETKEMKGESLVAAPSEAVTPPGIRPSPIHPPEPAGDGFSLRDNMEAAWLARRGSQYRWLSKDDHASREVLVAAGMVPGTALAVWERALERTSFPVCNGVVDLAKHWNAYAGAEPSRPRIDPGVIRNEPRGPLGPPVPPVACEVCGEPSPGEVEAHALCHLHIRQAMRSDLSEPADRRSLGEDIGTWIARKRPGPVEVAA